MATRIRVQGLDEFAKALDVLPEEWKTADKVFRNTAAREIVRRAQEFARTGSSPALQILAAKDVKATSTPGTVQYGGKAYDFGAEYGSLRYRQFKPWRGNGATAGYFFWPAVRDFQEHGLQGDYAEAIWAAVKKAFPNYN